LGGGCFWGMQDLIRKQEGVVKTTVGYSGGKNENPTYDSHEGHAEVVKIVYDDKKTSLRKLLDFFFQIHNPTTVNQQGNDIGTSYRSIIFYKDEKEKLEANEMISIVNKSRRWKNPVVTTVEPFVNFTIAEEYHQDYLIKNPGGYTCHVRHYGSYFSGFQHQA
jgi:peptide-methionine (S)-S-oxide reductase